jgi:Fur family transcriptional regulator, ferric uptake regulator
MPRQAKVNAAPPPFPCPPDRLGSRAGRQGGQAMNGRRGKAGLLARCEAAGLRLTGQRRLIAQVLEAAEDHPDVDTLFARAAARDPKISLATVYRTVRLFEEQGLLERHEFGDGRARYEDAERAHHDHLIDLATGEVIEFHDPEIEKLKAIARRLGYRLKGHRLELYGVKLKS